VNGPLLHDVWRMGCGFALYRPRACHLIQAANAGRTLLFQRTHRHSLAIQRLLEDVKIFIRVNRGNNGAGKCAPKSGPWRC
jgi:hypothetical protein